MKLGTVTLNGDTPVTVAGNAANEINFRSGLSNFTVTVFTADNDT